MNLLITLVLGLAVFVLLRTLSGYIRVFAPKRPFRMGLLRIFPLIELLFWLWYAFWSARQLFGHTEWYSGIWAAMILLSLISLAWYIFRDFLAGVILRTENALEPGQMINSQDIRGQIRKIGYRSLELESQDGSIIKVPYSLLSKQVLGIDRALDKGQGQVMAIIIPAQSNAEIIREMLYSRILEMPWIAPGKEIDVRIKRMDSESYKAEIHFYAVNPELSLKTEEVLLQFVQEVFVSPKT